MMRYWKQADTLKQSMRYWYLKVGTNKNERKDS